MVEEYRIEEMGENIRVIKGAATELLRVSGGIQAVDRNVNRILASIKMLEINISDIGDVVWRGTGIDHRPRSCGLRNQ